MEGPKHTQWNKLPNTHGMFSLVAHPWRNFGKRLASERYRLGKPRWFSLKIKSLWSHCKCESPDLVISVSQ